MDHLSAGIQFAFAVLPYSATLFQPSEGTFDDPTFRQHAKRMEFIALDQLHRGLQPPITQSAKGSPVKGRVTVELRRGGMVINHRSVRRLMREDNLLGIGPKAFIATTQSDHDAEVYLNLACRMELTAINQL